MKEQLLNKSEKLAVVGMGYVGFPLAVAFAERGIEVIGFDINTSKIEEYLKGNDPTHEVGNERLKKLSNIKFTSDEKDLREAKFIIIAVPTPVLKNKMPDLRPVEGASQVVGRNLTEGAIVVYESTVYPGVTEDICLPILEKESNKKCGINFKIGYITLLGFILYIGSFLMWQKLLTTYDLSYIVPITTGIVQVVVLLVSYFIFKEAITLTNLTGIIFVIVGIILISIKK